FHPREPGRGGRAAVPRLLRGRRALANRRHADRFHKHGRAGELLRTDLRARAGAHQRRRGRARRSGFPRWPLDGSAGRLEPRRDPDAAHQRRSGPHVRDERLDHDRHDTTQGIRVSRDPRAGQRLIAERTEGGRPGRPSALRPFQRPTMFTMNQSAPILVVDDDAKILRLVRTYLERDGFRVVEAGDGRSALAAIALEQPALVVLDLMLPEVDGLSVLRAVRRGTRTPVIILSARGTVTDRIEGLEEGADDYLPKPFSPAELIIRVRRVLERSGVKEATNGGAPIRHGDLVLDPDRHEVSVGDRPVALTAAEFRLLQTLLEAGGRVLTRDQLMDAM